AVDTGDRLEEFVELSCPVRVAQHTQGAGGQVGAVREVRRGQDVLAGLLADLEPVTVVVADLLAPDQIRVVSLHVVHPGDHGIDGLFEHTYVAGRSIDLPRDRHPAVTPGRCALPKMYKVRCDVRERPVRVLRAADITQPSGQQGRHVTKDEGGRCEDLRIGDPTQPLVTLWTVRGDRHEVSAQAPL